MLKLLTTFLLSLLVNEILSQKIADVTISSMPLHSGIELKKYVENPAKTDSLCISDSQRAQHDIANGKIVFCIPTGVGTLGLRQENELRMLCAKNNIVFDFEPYYCMNIAGQTQGCYGGYMDKIISEKLGNNFKEQLLSEADSILSTTNKRIYWRYCDTKPTIPGKNMWKSCELDAIIDKKLFEKLKPQKLNLGCVNWPTVTIGFHIDKNGNPSAYFLSEFDEVDQKSNLEYKSQLYQTGLELVKQQKKWLPGQINGRSVNTEMEVTVSFVPEK